MLERRERERDRTLLSDLGLVEVACRGAFLDPTGARDRPGRDEEGLGERRLAGPRVADEHDVPDSRGLVGRWCFADGGPCSVRLVCHVVTLPPTGEGGK